MTVSSRIASFVSRERPLSLAAVTGLERIEESGDEAGAVSFVVVSSAIAVTSVKGSVDATGALALMCDVNV